MRSTRQVLQMLSQHHPDAEITEDRLRRALRSGAIAPPNTFAGRLVWLPEDIAALCAHLGVEVPDDLAGQGIERRTRTARAESLSA